MHSLSAWFASPRLIDLIVLFAGVEALLLLAWRRARQRLNVGLMLLPGVFLMLALRAALAGAPWPWIPGALGAALVAHLLDLRDRLRR